MFRGHEKNRVEIKCDKNRIPFRWWKINKRTWHRALTSQIFLCRCSSRSHFGRKKQDHKRKLLSCIRWLQMQLHSCPWKSTSHSIRALQDSDTNSIYALKAMLSSSTISYTQLWQPIICDTQTATFFFSFFFGWEGHQGNPHPASQPM